jgi:hypothetical protein
MILFMKGCSSSNLSPRFNPMAFTMSRGSVTICVPPCLLNVLTALTAFSSPGHPQKRSPPPRWRSPMVRNIPQLD